MRHLHSKAAILLVVVLVSLFSFVKIPKVKGADNMTFTSNGNDGVILYSDFQYAYAWTRSSGTVSTSGTIELGQTKFGGSGPFIIYRDYIAFDTSGLGEDTAIVEAKLCLYFVADSSQTDFNITVQTGVIDTYPHQPLVSSDYWKAHYTGNGGSLDTAGYAAGYVNITLNADGRSWIKKDSTTKFCIRSDRDIAGTEPTQYEYVRIHTFAAGESYVPKLYVSYEAAMISPENVDVDIIDMAVGNYVFAEGKTYVFRAEYFDDNGYNDLTDMQISFTDGLHWINASYDGYVFTLLSGIDELSGSSVVNLSGNASTSGSDTYIVDFRIRFTRYILDVFNVDIYMYCEDSSELTDGPEIIQSDYFNIYNKGGLSTLTTSGNAGRLDGGDIFDLYAYNGSWAESSIQFRNLQHLKMLPNIEYCRQGSGSLGLTKLNYTISYYAHDQWIQGWTLILSDLYNVSDASYRYSNYGDCKWYQQGSLIKSFPFDTFLESPDTGSPGDVNWSSKVWVDLWFNKANASSVGGGRVNAYYFPMKNDANQWWRWLTGDAWGVYEELGKESMYFENLLDENGEVFHAQEIEMVKVTFRISVNSGYYNYIQLINNEVFDLTFGSQPFEGVQTPSFDESKVPSMPQGGFLGYLGSMFSGFFSALGSLLGPVAQIEWWGFTLMLDMIASWAGYPGLFSNLFAFLGNLWNGVVAGFTAFTSLLTSFLTMSGSFLSDITTTLTSGVSTWSSMVTMIREMLGGAYGVGFDLFTIISPFIPVALILYPMYLLYLWVDHGFDAVANHVLFVKDILVFIGSVFLRVIEIFVNIISSIIEKVPVIE